jgi:hypothetical protein
MDTKKTPKTPKYICGKCDYKTNNKKDFCRHVNTRKHSKETLWKQKKPLNCAFCEKNFNSRSGLYKHTKICSGAGNNEENNCDDDNLTNNDISKKVTNGNKKIQNGNQSKSAKSIFCQYCDKVYTYHSGLSRHVKKCHSDIQITVSSIINNTEKPLDANTKVHVGNLHMNELLMKCFETMTEQTQTINKLIPKIGNNNTINTTTHNTTNKLNLNVYLNETCKDAINLPEFMSNIHLQLDDLQTARRDGLLSSTKNVVIKELQSTESVHRPIQCTDIKRKTMYIKEAGEWNKDIGNEKLKSAMCNLSNKYLNIVKDWQGENPDHMQTDNGQMEFVKVMHSATQNILEEERKVQSAVKEIGETVQIK